MLEFLKLKESFTGLTVGIATVLIGLNGKWLDGDSISEPVRIAMISTGLGVMLAGYALSLRWAWTTPGKDVKDPTKFKADYTGRARFVSGVMNFVAGGLLIFVITAAAYDAIIEDDASDPRAEFAESLAGYINAVDDDDAAGLFKAQMTVFSKCRPAEKSGSASDGVAQETDTVLIQEICRQLLDARGLMSRPEAARFLSELTQPTPVVTQPDGGESVTPSPTESR